MGFLTSAEAVIARALAEAMMPPPPPDITRWCEENIVFDERSPFPGPFRADRFRYLREIHEVLSPEHPCREVTVRGSAQIGKTLGVINPTLGAWHEYGPLDSLVVHPTNATAVEWVMQKWLPMRRTAPGLRRVFGDGRGENKDTVQNQETLARNGSLKVATAGSAADLTGTTRRLVIMDDLAKYDSTDHGDPEELAESRAQAFDDAKILRVSTPGVVGSCRISKAYDRSDRRVYEVPCPHCGTFQTLTWQNFRASIRPEALHAAHFTCESCGCVIGHEFKERMAAAGRWRVTNPGGDHPGFHIWGVYAPFRDWASIAAKYARLMGWSSVEAGPETKVSAESEQVFFNDVLGLPYEMATGGLDWEAVRNRAEVNDGSLAEAIPPVGVIPAGGFLLAAGVDCQDDRMEVQVVAFTRNRRRWTVDYRVIPHHVGTEEGRAALTALVRTSWRTTLGLKVGLDGLAIDGGTYTEDVWAWARLHDRTRVIVVKGASGQNGPPMQPMKYERRVDGKLKRDKRGFMLNVSLLKGEFYSALSRTDPMERGHIGFARGLGDEYYRQLCSERRVVKRNRYGVTVSQWELVEPARRNEGLDTALYAEAAARRRGWAALTDEQWDALEAERGAAPAEPQGDLFEAVPVVPLSAPVAKPRAEATAPPPEAALQERRPAAQGYIRARADWLRR